MKLRDLFEAMDLYKYHSNPEKLHGYDKKHMATPEMAFEALKGGKLNAQQKKEAESVIATDPKLAYEYARYVIKGRWPEGEPAIAKDPRWAYWYARDVIKGRFPEAEPVIAKDPHLAKNYNEFIKGLSK
jgi:hypothetical protein